MNVRGIYRFRYVVELLVQGKKLCNKNKLDESIKDEYSTMIVDGIDKTIR
jgi:hypothetical protein